VPKSSVVERAPEGKGTGARFGLSKARSVDKPRWRGFFDLHLAFLLVMLWLLGVAIIASPYLIERAS
jgi:hypothetical protein